MLSRNGNSLHRISPDLAAGPRRNGAFLTTEQGTEPIAVNELVWFTQGKAPVCNCSKSRATLDKIWKQDLPNNKNLKSFWMRLQEPLQMEKWTRLPRYGMVKSANLLIQSKMVNIWP